MLAFFVGVVVGAVDMGIGSGSTISTGPIPSILPPPSPLLFHAGNCENESLASDVRETTDSTDEEHGSVDGDKTGGTRPLAGERDPSSVLSFESVRWWWGRPDGSKDSRKDDPELDE
jgi:hypothetical protein